MSYLYNCEHKSKLKTRSHIVLQYIFLVQIYFERAKFKILQECTNGLLLDDKNMSPFTHYLTPEGNN